VTGVNAIGLRQRQDVWEHWLGAQTPIGTVVAQLAKANFDPEFSRQHEPAIRREFAQQFPDLPLPAASRRRGFFSAWLG
jgi:hypothetical protein